MGNIENGVVSFEVNGIRYNLKLSTNAICELESMTGKGLNEFAAILGDVSTFKVTDMRSMFHACLMGGGNQLANAEAVGDIMDALTMETVGELVQQTFGVAFPEAKDAEGKANAAS